MKRHTDGRMSKPIIGITMGDFNGIGPEITLKEVLGPAVRRCCYPVLIGSMAVYEYYARRLRCRITLRQLPPDGMLAGPAGIPVVTLAEERIPLIRPGTTSAEAGELAANAIEVATSLALKGAIDAIVTAPISKSAMARAGYRYPGQTEFLADLSRSEGVIMMLVAKDFRVGLATIHVPLRSVAGAISAQGLLTKLRIMERSLRRDFGIPAPRIAVLGVNPHAGEGGWLGKEDQRTILPAVHAARRARIRTDGPFPADGFFGSGMERRYDAILAMYHDQGLIPLKMKGFDVGVNYSAGLRIIRTSPDHGTAFDIAGKGIASGSSMREAIRLAATIYHNRLRKSHDPIR